MLKLRSILLTFTCATLATAASAQFKVNPQIGGSFTNLTHTPSGVTTSAAFGFQLGADFRIGDRLYFQPGAYFGRSATLVKISYLDTSVIQDNLIRTTAKVKALLGYNIIHEENFKLRVNAGPTYEALLSVDSKDDKIDFNKDNYNGGSFNMDAGLGVDISVITLETGVSYGLSNAYKDQGKLMGDSKYFTWYATLGLVFGGGK
ncbi:MAG: outer membrane beta-barrel protein [Flavobacteriales bacterium]